MSPQDDPLHTPKETADIIRTPERTLERWRLNGSGPAFTKVGRRIYYRESSLRSYLERQTRQDSK